MLIRAAVTFFLIGLLSLILGAYNFAGMSMEIGRMLLFAFIILAVISVVASLVQGRGPKQLL